MSLGSSPAHGGGLFRQPHRPPPGKRAGPRLRLKVEHWLVLFLVFNLAAAAGELIAWNWAENQLAVNSLGTAGYQARIASLREMGAGGGRLQANLQKAGASLQAAQVSIPAAFSSLDTIDYVFQVAGITGVNVSGMTIGATAPSGGLFATQVQVQVAATDEATLLGFVQALNVGDRLAVARIGGADYSPGPKNAAVSIAFYTRRGGP
jgi:hypothetical protein